MPASKHPINPDRKIASTPGRVPGEKHQSGPVADPVARSKPAAEMPRHRAIYEELLSDITSGVYKPGERLPSEAVLCERFMASRITVAKAFQSLQRDKLVTRRPGSGTFVERPVADVSHQFGVLIPDFGTTDIFEPICQGILRSPEAHRHSLTWSSSVGGGTNAIEAAEQLCRQYISQRVSGVFFAPTEFSESRDQSNRHLISMLESAAIPVVLLDRDFEGYPDRSHFDLVGIDNHRAGYVLTRHLLEAGANRVVFAMRRNSAPTVDARAAGYRNALYALCPDATPAIFSSDFEDISEVQRMIKSHRPDAVVCANDVTAARLMQMLISLGLRVPGDIRMAGIDDVRYAKFLATPLTSLRQNCSEIGSMAMSTMLDRIAFPNHPVRDVLVRCELVVRASSGVPASQQTVETQ